jgi:hypothetical protein
MRPGVLRPGPLGPAHIIFFRGGPQRIQRPKFQEGDAKLRQTLMNGGGRGGDMTLDCALVEDPWHG